MIVETFGSLTPSTRDVHALAGAAARSGGLNKLLTVDRKAPRWVLQSGITIERASRLIEFFRRFARKIRRKRPKLEIVQDIKKSGLPHNERALLVKQLSSISPNEAQSFLEMSSEQQSQYLADLYNVEDSGYTGYGSYGQDVDNIDASTAGMLIFGVIGVMYLLMKRK